MDFTHIDFLPKISLIDHNMAVEECVDQQQDVEPSMAIPEIEKAEALETLGIAEFFQGDYHSATEHLAKSLAFKLADGKRSPRRLCNCLIMLALARFRLGDVAQSDEDLQEAVKIGQEAKHTDLTAIALTNRALILAKKEVLQQAIMQSRKAIELSAEIHAKSSFEHLQHVRVLIALYLKSREYSKAEIVLEESEFPHAERVLLDAGIALALSDHTKATAALRGLYETLNRRGAVTGPLDMFFPAAAPLEDVGVGEGLMGEDTSHMGMHHHGEGLALHGGSVMTESSDMVPSSIPGLEALLQRAQLLYNLSLLDRMGHEHGLQSMSQDQEQQDHERLPALDAGKLFRDAVHMLRSIVGKLYSRRKDSIDREVRHDNEQDLFQFGPDSQRAPNYLPYDYYQHSIAMWSTMLLAKAENHTLDMSYDHAIRQQRGELVVDDEEMVSNMQKLEVSYRSALGVLEACKTQALDNDLLFDDKPKEQHEPEVKEEPQEEDADEQEQLDDDGESLLSEQVSEMEMIRADDPDTSATKDALKNYHLFQEMHSPDAMPVVMEAGKILKHHGVDFNPISGQLINHGPTKKGKQEPVTSDSLSDGDIYCAAKVDRVSTRAEMIPLLDKFGRDEVSAWITWALASSGGVSLGCLGSSCVSAADITVDGMDSKSQAFLIEVRNRLLEVDRRLSFSYEHDDAYHFGELESRVIVLILLVKLTAQLLMKAEVQSLLVNLTKAADMLHRKRSCVESRTYLALARRFKYEYEDWLMLPFMSNEERSHRLFSVMLPLVKAYFHIAKDLPDVHLRKDAYKKMINMYTALHKCCMKAGHSASSSIQSGGTINSTAGKELTLQEVAALDEHVLEQCEANDQNWLLKHSRHRAMCLFQQMKQIIMER